MQVLIVYAHPERTSFTAAMKDAAVTTLRSAGHGVVVSDLYLENFNPVAGRHDFTGVADAERFHYQTEQLHASSVAGGFCDELRREQARLLNADFVVFVAPVWWGGLPAILKGWFDRVCAYGVAYADGQRFDKGLFVGRRALIGLSSGGTQQRFSDGDAYGDIARVLYPTTRCILEYLGLEVMDPFIAYAAPRVDDLQRGAYLANWSQRVVAAVSDPGWQSRVKPLPVSSASEGPGGLGWRSKN